MTHDGKKHNYLQDFEYKMFGLLGSKEINCLFEACGELLSMCSSALAKDDVDSFIDLGFRMHRVMEKTNFPDGWSDDDQNRLPFYHGQLHALSQTAIFISEEHFEQETIDYLMSHQIAVRIIHFLMKEGPLKWSELENKLKESESVTKINPNTIKRPLDRLQRANIIRRIGQGRQAYYKLTFLGSELGLTIDESTSLVKKTVASEIYALWIDFAKGELSLPDAKERLIYLLKDHVQTDNKDKTEFKSSIDTPNPHSKRTLSDHSSNGDDYEFSTEENGRDGEVPRVLGYHATRTEVNNLNL